MKKGITLVALLVVLCVVSVLYYKVKNDTNETEQNEEEVTEEKVLQINQADVESLCFQLDGENVTFKKQESKWSVEEHPDFEVDSNKVESVLSDLVNMTSVRTLENVERIDEYGLNAPMQTVQIVLKDGTKKEILFGDINDATANSYVCIKEDLSKVYTVIYSVERAFEGKLEDYKVTEEK